ncbi:hypothetical protein HPB47_006721 [Ixodes persulcatus]|uniref:Uncharacterized protein n=1 Tax=Ixodes persulcatus TaxID=34615 RepID=A0AC60P9J8_IXOPE|nr:hypothetical protein HPB47_006721 [Ixodes persulcatus]
MDWRGNARTFLNTTKLKAHDKEAAVVAFEVLPEDTGKGVAHGVDPSLQPEQLFEALYELGREIYYAITMGKGGLALVTFQGQRQPRSVAFYGEYIRVTLYKPYRMTCHNCLELGHKENVDTAERRTVDQDVVAARVTLPDIKKETSLCRRTCGERENLSIRDSLAMIYGDVVDRPKGSKKAYYVDLSTAHPHYVFLAGRAPPHGCNRFYLNADGPESSCASTSGSLVASGAFLASYSPFDANHLLSFPST